MNCLLIRKIVKPAPVKAEVKTSPTINLLVVIARPNADEDVAYRTISRPLVIFVEFEDQKKGGLTIGKLASLYQKTQDNNLLSEVAAILKVREAIIREAFEELKS